MERTKIIIMAPAGRMDRLIVKAAAAEPALQIVGGVGTPGRNYIGKDIALAAGLPEALGALTYGSLDEVPADFDLVIDFSTTELSMEVLQWCHRNKKALLCGTTGFTREQEEQFLLFSHDIPLMRAANTSFVVNVMKGLLSQAATSFGTTADIEIIDMHSRDKRDSPSGTALELGQVIQSAPGDGNGISPVYHSVRAGDIVSSHTVLFGFLGERLEITHHAHSWDCYAEGACKAALFMKDKVPGFYRMEDVIIDRKE